jgi:hypothetical protein
MYWYSFVLYAFISDQGNFLVSVVSLQQQWISSRNWGLISVLLMLVSDRMSTCRSSFRRELTNMC